MRWQSAGGLFMVTLAGALACGGPDSGLFDDSLEAAGGGSPNEPGDAGEGGGQAQGGETGDAGEGGDGSGGTGAVGAGGAASAGQGTGGTGAGGTAAGGDGAGGSSTGGSGIGGTASAGEGGTGGSGGSIIGGTGGSSGSAGSGGTTGKVCPEVLGKYEIDDVDGNCSNLDSDVVQSVDATDDPCTVHFVSEGALNGSAPLDEDGDFTGVTLAVGNSVRSDCSGTWNEGEERMTVTCGLNFNRCIVRLERL